MGKYAPGSNHSRKVLCLQLDSGGRVGARYIIWDIFAVCMAKIFHCVRNLSKVLCGCALRSGAVKVDMRGLSVSWKITASTSQAGRAD